VLKTSENHVSNHEEHHQTPPSCPGCHLRISGQHCQGIRFGACPEKCGNNVVLENHEPWKKLLKTKHGSWKTMEKPWKNHGKTMEKPWKNHGKPCFMEN